MGGRPFVESSSLSTVDTIAMIGGAAALTVQGLKHLNIERPLISLKAILALTGTATLLTGCSPKPIETISVPKIDVVNFVNANPDQQEKLNTVFDNFVKTASDNKLNYPGDENNPVKQGGLKQVVAAALNVNENVIDPNDISVAYPEEISFGNNQVVKIEYVEYKYTDGNGQPQKKIVIFGSDKDGQWGLVGLTNEPFVIQSLPNAGVVANNSDGKQLQKLFTGFPPNTQIPFTGIFISGGKNGAVFSSALYFTQDDGGIRFVFRDDRSVLSGPVPRGFQGAPTNNPEGLFNTSYKIASLNQIIPPTPANTPKPTEKPTETPTPTETPVGPAIPQEVADKYPQGINIEYVGTNRLPLANDTSSGNLIGWYSEKDSAWHFADEGMQMKYIENFDNLGPVVITEVVKSEDITAQTLADWEAKINLPGEVIFGTADDISIAICPAQYMILENLVLTNFIDERVTLNPGLAAQTDFDRVWFNFAFRKNNISHTLKVETRVRIGYSGTLWHIDSQEILSKFELGKKFYTDLQVVRPESECTNKQLLALSQTSMDPLTWRFTIGRLGDIKISIEELKALLSDHNEVILTRDQARVSTVSPYNRPP